MRIATLLLTICIIFCAQMSYAACSTVNAQQPSSPVKLIFIHHSCGENWLADGNGNLGQTLGQNNYFVSDTNYGWGSTGIGDLTDIGHWWNWFRGSQSSTILSELYNESGQNSYYTRTLSNPGGENEIIMFKSCYPNSGLSGNPTDAATSGSNPLRGQDYSSGHMTVANAKGIYNDILQYFATRQDKLFIAVTAPPMDSSETSASQAANARAFNNWLVNDWLDGYAYNNVAVFDFYNVLTSNGGSISTNDAGAATGNHHRIYSSQVQHSQTVSYNMGAYSVAGDSHPSSAGNQKATTEFVPLLNHYYNCWKANGGGGGTPNPPTSTDYLGWWYNPSEPGTGVSIGRNGNVIFMAWYAFDASGNAVWYVSWLQGSGSTYTGDLRSFTGWPIGSAWSAPDNQAVGTVTLTFTDYDNGTLSWNLTSLGSGSKTIKKYMPDLVPGGSHDSRGISGWYTADGYPGMGFFLEAYGDTLYLGWYHYVEGGAPRWRVLGGWDHVGQFADGATSFSGTFLQLANGQTIGGPTKSPIILPGGDSGVLNVSADGSTVTLTWGGHTTFNLSEYVIEMPDFGTTPGPTGDFALVSGAFAEGQTIPDQYTCHGSDVSPPLTFQNIPSGTKSFALIMDDPDADGGNYTFIHWVIYNIPGSYTSLPQNIDKVISLPDGSMQGGNDMGHLGYSGPCPPSGDGLHHYYYKLYALDTMLSLEPGSNKFVVEAAMQGHILAQAQLMGVYSN